MGNHSHATSPFQTISVIGLGYIGLPTAALLASRRVRVIGVDVSSHVVDTINRGQIHILEPDLDMVVRAAVNQGYLRASTTPEPADAFLIAVPTPFSHEDSPPSPGDFPKPDLSFIESAARSLAPVLKRGDLVILESTSPVGTTAQMSDWLARARPDLRFPQEAGDDADIHIAYCPERVLPGKVLHELVYNDRIIGGMTPRCAERAIALYKLFVDADCFPTNSPTAELCKLTENAFRDVNIAFANELSLICDEVGIDVWELIALANRHPRVNILRPGPGVGGHCIAVDPWFIVAKTPHLARIIHAARNVNDQKPLWVLKKIQVAVADYLQQHPEKSAGEVTVACFGLAFKPDIDDLRESPALEIVQRLANQHPGPLLAVEPNLRTRPAALPDSVTLVSAEAAQQQAQIAVLLVAHRSFRELSWEDRRYQVIDTCGIMR